MEWKRHFYESLDGYFDYEALYLEAAAAVPAGGIAVEVGVWRGKSLAFLAVEFANRAKQVRLVGVDLFGTTEDMQHPATPHTALLQLFLNHGVNAELHQRISWEAADSFADGSVDFVFIDAAHDYESVSKDLAAWWPKVKLGGIMAGHDATIYHPGVLQAVSEKFGNLLPVETVKHCWRVFKPA
jgi:predicted O-methyltransferase YrrM